MVSGTAYVQDPSDMELLSMCGGGPASEAGSLFDTTQNNAAASDERRELEAAYKDLHD